MSFSSIKAALAALCLAAGTEICICQTLPPAKAWKEYEIAGKKAYAENHLSEADHLLNLAVGEAEKLPADDGRLSESLIERAQVCAVEQHFPDAEVLLRWAFVLDSRRLGTNDLQTAGDALEMAILCGIMGRFEEAHILVDQAQSAVERKTGRWTTAVGICMLHRGNLYMAEPRFPEAEKSFSDALRLIEASHTTVDFRVLAPGGPPITRTTWLPNPTLIARARNDLGFLYLRERKYSEAGDCFKTALNYFERQFGTKSPALADVLNNIAALKIAQRQFGEARDTLNRASALEKTLDASDLRVIRTGKLLGALEKSNGAR